MEIVLGDARASLVHNRFQLVFTPQPTILSNFLEIPHFARFDSSTDLFISVYI